MIIHSDTYLCRSSEALMFPSLAFSIALAYAVSPVHSVRGIPFFSHFFTAWYVTPHALAKGCSPTILIALVSVFIMRTMTIGYILSITISCFTYNLKLSSFTA